MASRTVSLGSMRTAIFVASAFLFAACNSSPERAGSLVTFDCDFEKDAPLTLPQLMESLESTAGPRAHWHVKEGGADGSARHVHIDAEKSTGEHFHLLLTEVPMFHTDVRLGVKVRAEGGKEDQGGGLVWRARDEQNYYIARWNPLEDNVRIYRVKDGVRAQLETAKVSVPTDAWHTLEIAARGPHMTVMFDGQSLFTIDDDTFADAGRIGFWTKADACTSFDQLKAGALAR